MGALLQMRQALLIKRHALQNMMLAVTIYYKTRRCYDSRQRNMSMQQGFVHLVIVLAQPCCMDMSTQKCC